ncbi:MAG: FAD-dependent monooxygenase [Thaumarchaeota archaeon]|nr:FAD-dependent monooxygenase [Nitrososphaerota archaeon]
MIHIIISGGGVAGAGLACTLLDLVEARELEITVLEKESKDDIGYVKRGQVLRPEASKLIFETKLIDYLKKKNPVLKYSPKEELWHSALGLMGSFDYEILAKGYPMIYLPHPLIVESLHERMAEGGIRVVYGADAVNFEREADGNVAVNYRSKELKGSTHRVSGDLLVVADGATSNVRTSLKIGVDFYDYKSGYLVVILDRFPSFEDDRFLINERGFVPLFSLPDQGLRAMVEINVENLRGWMALSPDQIQKRLGEWLPELAQCRVREIGSFYHVIRRHARSYVSDRAALIGDAAHTTHPMLGQGMSMVFNDIAALSSIIRSDPPSAASKASLELYEKRARPFDSSVLNNSHELHEAILEIGRVPKSITKYGELLDRVGFKINSEMKFQESP